VTARRPPTSTLEARVAYLEHDVAELRGMLRAVAEMLGDPQGTHVRVRAPKKKARAKKGTKKA
jgi:hypothetical protein